jgi:hypothetical protein
MTESGAEFWYKQNLASRSPEDRVDLQRRVELLQIRKNQLRARIDELEAREATDEEWAAYDEDYARWNNEVMDLAEEAQMPFPPSDTGAYPIVSPDTHAQFSSLMEGYDVPFEGNRRIGGNPIEKSQ